MSIKIIGNKVEIKNYIWETGEYSVSYSPIYEKKDSCISNILKEHERCSNEALNNRYGYNSTIVSAIYRIEGKLTCIKFNNNKEPLYFNEE